MFFSGIRAKHYTRTASFKNYIGYVYHYVTESSNNSHIQSGRKMQVCFGCVSHFDSFIPLNVSSFCAARLS